MSRQWQVGDLAVVTTETGHEYCGAYQFAPGIDYFWQPIAGERSGGLIDRDVSARPLVVIDPDDREQVNRLADAFCSERWSHTDGSDECDPLTRSSMQAALRSLTADPKPEEPTGLGAVVIDASDREWVHFGNGCWIKTVPNANYHTKPYADIDVREVKSAGWSE